MTLKLGTLMLLAGAAVSAGAQSPTAVENIYSQTGAASTESGAKVAYEFANWYSVESNDNAALWSALFDQMVNLENSGDLVEGVSVDANGISLTWSAADKLLSVKCEDGKLGHTQVLITDYNGVNRGVSSINESPAVISLSNYVPGTYIVAVAVDGQLVKTLKLILK